MSLLHSNSLPAAAAAGSSSIVGADGGIFFLFGGR
jgi:hypothetical protein